MNKSKNSNPPYTGLSAYYDEGWGKFALSYLPFLLKQVEDRRLRAPRALDVCCGTGLLAKALAEKGVSVLGVDRSEEMLAQARKNCADLPNVEFRHSEMTQIAFESEFDWVTCTFDSINYLLDKPDLLIFFNRLAAALKPEGRFIFDSNTRSAYLTWPEEEYTVLQREVGGAVFRQLLRFDHTKSLAEVRFEFPDGISETHIQRPWDEREVREIIAKSDLCEEWIKSNFSLSPTTDDTMRILVLASKKEE